VPPTQPLSSVSSGEVIPPAYNINNQAATTSSDSQRNSHTSFRDYNNKLAAIEGGYWRGQYGTSPYLKIAPVFAEMSGAEPVKGQSMYDWKNSPFAPLPINMLPTLIQAFESVREYELKRLAGDATSRVAAKGVVIGDAASGGQTIIAFGNDLDNMGMYLMIRSVRNNVVNDVLYDLTREDTFESTGVRTGYDHTKCTFGNVVEPLKIPLLILITGDFLMYAYRSYFLPLNMGTGGGASRQQGTPLQPPRTPAVASQPPTSSLGMYDSLDLE
jgi:hypothetical protein